MGPKTVVVLSGYDTVKEALVNHADAFAGRPKIQIIKETGKGKGECTALFPTRLPSTKKGNDEVFSMKGECRTSHFVLLSV